MADTKITALAAIGANPINVATFPIPMVDLLDNSMAASGTTKKVTVNQILGAGGTATLASATISGDLTVDTTTLKVDSANDRVGLGIAAPAYRLHVQGTASLQLVLQSNDTNANAKEGTVNVRHYTNAEEPVSAVGGFTTSTANEVYLGGGFNGGNAATLLGFYTAANNTTTIGTERYRIASDGVATWSNVGGVAGTAMTLNATGLGVGASPVEKLTVAGRGLFVSANPDNAALKLEASAGTNSVAINFVNTGGNYFVGVDNSVGGRLYGVPYSLCIGSTGAYPVVIATNNTARLTVKSTGQVRFVPLAADPSGAESGDVYYNSSSNKLKCYNGSTWNDLF